VGYSSFSIEIPLVTGVNNLLVKVKQGDQDAVTDVGISQLEIQAIGI
jgi:hypothetical protein